MKFTLIVCTYKRPHALGNLLASVKLQTVYPDEILIVDGSPDDATQRMLEANPMVHLTYYKVDESNRGLTKQRNYGIARVAPSSEVVCFLDDDTVLKPNYFEAVITAFQSNEKITGVGGVAVNENQWVPINPSKKYKRNEFFTLEGFVVKEALRNKIRNDLGLQSNLLPGKMPDYSHGRTCGYPLTGKNYEVDLLIGMSMSFRKKVVDSISFSKYFEGYGLYEDADFSIRALQFGSNVICTQAQLEHHHDPAGRPNQYHYGKMVVRNGWYVWRVKYPYPSFSARWKWHAITLLLTAIRATNIITTSKKKEAFTETLGRVVGWCSLFWDRPKI
ncbi:glycosyltransferase family 2 protein [Flavobacterium luminosum]|uniref:Glycosyltransferase n=1 Tax=Flavobacterium luminosum TaxID=2949086 RepID=A0ABT0TNJ8_9FLAO|nr:glycosyltransferase [Flavobacterium sp. HXWNR70]MCL9809073.1 glycosyltransferase [Flavobacterium sp. HXWNR70]